MDNNLLSEKLAYNGESLVPTHLHLCSYNAAEMKELSAETFSGLLPELADGKIHWLQIHGLQNTDMIREICTHFGVDFLVIQDILNTDHPSKIEEYDSFNLVITRLFGKEEEPFQACMVQGDRFVLTFLENESGFFDGVSRAIRNNVLKIRARTSDYLLTVLLNGLVADYISVASEIGDALDDLESELLAAAGGRDIGAQIQTLRRRYMLLKRTVLPLKEQYMKLLRSESPLIRKSSRAFFNDVNDHLSYVAQSIDICRETLSSLMDLYISNNDLRMNDIMKRLTIVSTIFIPLTFLVGVWGMNFRYMPELEWRYGYLAAWCVMVLIGAGVFFFFRRRKWR